MSYETDLVYNILSFFMCYKIIVMDRVIWHSLVKDIREYIENCEIMSLNLILLDLKDNYLI
jgi:hypothetical protein